MSERYDSARICENGHIINDALCVEGERTTDCCIRCGAKGIQQCADCNAEIRGALLHQSLYNDWRIRQHIRLPGYCHKCGKAYPWTEAKKIASQDLIEELTELSREEKENFTKSLDVLFQQKPGEELAIARIKRILGKVGKESYKLAKDVLTDILAGVISKAIFKE